MPIYQFRCVECRKPKDAILPMAERNNSRICKCGGAEERLMSLPAPAYIRPTGQDLVLKILNQEEGSPGYPGGDMHKPRYEQIMGKSLDYVRPLEERVFTGF